MLFFSWLALLVLVSADALQAAQLSALSLESPDYVIPVTGSNLSLFSQPDREHYTLLVLTSTDEKHECDSCIPLKTIVRRVAHAWFADYLHTDYLFFAEVDIVDRSNVEMFRHIGLQTVPQIWLIPPSNLARNHYLAREPKYDADGIEYFDNYDILFEPHAEFSLPSASMDKQIYEFANWLAKAVQKQIMLRQENPLGKFAATFAATFGLILLIKKRGPSFITGTVTKSKIYKVLFFAALLLIMGGYLFTTIQKVPFIAANDDGEAIFISGGVQYQFGVEMLIIGAVYLLLASNLALLVFLGQYKVTKKSALNDAQLGTLIIAAAALLYVLYSVLTSIFLRKDGGYPYYFLRLF